MVLIVAKTSRDFFLIFWTVFRGRESTSKFQKYLLPVMPVAYTIPFMSFVTTVSNEKKQISSVLLIKNESYTGRVKMKT